MDEPKIWIVSHAVGDDVFANALKEGDPDRPDAWTLKLRYPSRRSPVRVTYYGSGRDRANGCQYVSWSTDGRFLAASCDRQGSCAVWRTRLRPDGRCDASLVSAIATDAPTLPCVFHPGMPDVVLCAEERWRLWSFSAARKVPEQPGAKPDFFPQPAAQQLIFPPVLESREDPQLDRIHRHASPPKRPFRITGIAPLILHGCVSEPQLAVATENGVWFLELMPHVWSPQMHHRYPPRFRDAVRTFLLSHSAVARRPDVPDSARMLASLPRDLVARVVSLLAVPLHAWAPPSGSACASSLRPSSLSASPRAGGPSLPRAPGASAASLADG